MEPPVDVLIFEGLYGDEKKRDTDEFIFFSEFFHNFRPDLEEEYRAQVVNSTGFIDWSFFVGSAIPSEDSAASRYHRLQYRAVLKKVIDELQKITKCEYDSVLVEFSAILRNLRMLAWKVVQSRAEKLQYSSGKRPNNREPITFPEEVLNLWLEILKNIDLLKSGITYHGNNSGRSMEKYKKSIKFTLLRKIIFSIFIIFCAVCIFRYIPKLIRNYFYAPPPPPPSKPLDYLGHIINKGFQKLQASVKKILK